MATRISVDIYNQTKCAICTEELKSVCIVCLQNKTADCPTISGRCGHVYHKCCIDRFNKNRIVCPLDNKPWKVASTRSPKSLIQQCHKRIGLSIELTLEGIFAGPSVVTNHDWSQIHKKINKPKYWYTLKRPENMSLEALRVLQVQFKTPITGLFKSDDTGKEQEFTK